MANVEVAIAVFSSRTDAVRRQAQAGAEIPIRANLVEGMGIGVSDYAREAMEISRSQSGLQAVVVGFVHVLHLVDEAQIRKLGVKRPACLLAMTTSDLSRGLRINLIDVADIN